MEKSKVIKTIKLIAISFSAAFVLFFAAAMAVPLESENTVDVFNNTIRLRVVANSDSETDQTLKLAVRNDIISVAHNIFADCTDISSARIAVDENMGTLLAAAKKSAARHGCTLPINISFGTEVCPVRRYSDFTFPAGEYMTLRIDIGKAEGQNWWCVMFPPLCVSAASNDVSADVQVFKNHGFTDKQLNELLREKLKTEWFFMKLFDR